MTERSEELGVDQEGATAPPPLINSKNHRPGRELDALIGVTVMDWRWLQPPVVRQPILMPPEQWQSVVHRVEVDRAGLVNCHDWPPPRLPLYSTDMGAAWQVVEDMRRRGLHFELTDIRDDGAVTRGILWCAGFWANGEYRRRDPQQSETAPHAICLAALRALDA